MNYSPIISPCSQQKKKPTFSSFIRLSPLRLLTTSVTDSNPSEYRYYRPYQTRHTTPEWHVSASGGGFPRSACLALQPSVRGSRILPGSGGRSAGPFSLMVAKGKGVRTAACTFLSNSENASEVYEHVERSFTERRMSLYRSIALFVLSYINHRYQHNLEGKHKNQPEVQK